MQKILKEEKLYVTDTSMRDAQQSLVATRMRSKDLCGAAYATNAFMQNAFSVEAWGGATFDTAYRILKESPWKRLTTLRERMPNTLIQMLLPCVQCRWIQQLSGQPCKRVHSDFSREWNRCIPYF